MTAFAQGFLLSMDIGLQLHNPSLGARGSGSLPDPRRGRAHDVHPRSLVQMAQGALGNGIFVLLYGLGLVSDH